MKTTEKKLVEQAWSLQEYLMRYIEITCIRCSGIANCKPASRKGRLNRVHARAYERYLRRLKKLWA